MGLLIVRSDQNGIYAKKTAYFWQFRYRLDELAQSLNALNKSGLFATAILFVKDIMSDTTVSQRQIQRLLFTHLLF